MSDEMDEIWVLYADDGGQAMDAMEAALLALRDSATEDAPALVAALFRAVHTFKGNSRVLGLETVESRAHLAEDLIGLVRDHGVTLDDEILSLLLETGDRLREMLEKTARNRSDVDPADTEELVARLRAKIARCMAGQPGESVRQDLVADAVHDDSDPGESDVPDACVGPPVVQAVTPAAEAPRATPDAGTAGQGAPNQTAPETTPTDAGPSGPKLSDDAAYLAIFAEMVEETLSVLRTTEHQPDPETIERALKRLSHAARQLGLESWQDLLSGLPDRPEQGDLSEMIRAIESHAGAAVAPAAKTELAPTEGGFFDRIAEPLAVISRLGMEYSIGSTPDVDKLHAAIASLCAVAESSGYVRVIGAARTLLAVEEAGAFRLSELRLYEELASVELAICGSDLADGISPSRLLQKWSADHAFETLDELSLALDKARAGRNTEAEQRRLERLFRLVHHACCHFRLEVASDLSMSILDLLSRNHVRGDPPDAILLQIARGFADTLELVFDAMREGELPDTMALEALFREAAEHGFIGSGTVTAGTIERRLGLPQAFHRVLSPESTRAASLALEQGFSFYILRADVNTDDALAERLFDLIGSGQVQALTNVTVFEGEKTIFDFLLASELDEVQIAEALAQLDPGGRQLVLQQRLTPAGQEDIAEHGDDATADAGTEPIVSTDISSEILEQLGEVAAGQAMLQNMLGDLSDSDLSETMDSVLRQNSGDLRAARQAMRSVGDQLNEQLREIAQLGTQILGHLSELQQLTASLRTRPAATVLRPLAALVATHSRSNGFEAALTATGGEESLDVAMLNTLRNAMQPYLQKRLSQPVHAPRRLHMAVRKLDDQVLIIVDDDGAVAPSNDMVARLEAETLSQGGSLRVIRRPEGGFRLHLFLPVNLVVLEGMVVGARQTRYVVPVSAIRSILQPEPSAIVPVSDPDGQSWWLRLNEDELIPVKNISVSAPGDRDGGYRPDKDQIYIVLSLSESHVALPVDELLGQQLVLSRPLRGVMSGLQGVSGVALLSRGDVAMVLSPDSFCPANAYGPPAASLNLPRITEASGT